MLVLFDIDGTLLLSRGASMACFKAAGRELFARDFETDGVSFGGGLDPQLWRALCRRNGIEDAEAHHERFRAAYGRKLAERLGEGGVAYALPGVTALLDVLAAHDGRLAVGLLTGNYPETGCLKLQAAGLDVGRFSVAAWGTDGVHRRELFPVALARHAARTGQRLPAERVVIVGDTPHDVDVAAAHGARSLGVATGAAKLPELQAAGATLALPDLSETERVVDWILG
jgi:phosphoglycolate phosphatase